MNSQKWIAAAATITVILNATAGVFGVTTIIRDASWLVPLIASIVLVGKSILVHQWGKRGALAACLSIPPILAGVTVSVTSHYSVMFDAWQRSTLSATTARSHYEAAEQRVIDARTHVAEKDAAWAEEIKRGGEGRVGSSLRLDRDRMAEALRKAEELASQARTAVLQADSSTGPLLPAAQSLGLPIREVSFIYLGLFAIALELTEIGLLLCARNPYAVQKIHQAQTALVLEPLPAVSALPARPNQLSLQLW